jgi:hypothetical protein
VSIAITEVSDPSKERKDMSETNKMSSLHLKIYIARTLLKLHMSYKEAGVFFYLLLSFSLSTLHWRPMQLHFSMRSSR